MSEYEAEYLVCYYKDIILDDADFTNGMAPLLLPDGQKENDTAGKIALWAWEENGLSGLIAPDRVALSGESFLDGHVGYCKLHSKHFLSRHARRHFMRFIAKHKA